MTSSHPKHPPTKPPSSGTANANEVIGLLQGIKHPQTPNEQLLGLPRLTQPNSTILSPRSPVKLSSATMSRDISHLSDRVGHGSEPTKTEGGRGFVDTTVPPSLIPKSDYVVEQRFDKPPDPRDFDFELNSSTKQWHVVVFPALRPSGRRDAILLEQWLNKKLDEHRIEWQEKKTKGPSAPQVQALAQASDIYSGCFVEIVRQVWSNCAERGKLLQRVWEYHQGLFSVIQKTLEKRTARQDRELTACEKRSRLLQQRLNAQVVVGRELQGKISELDEEIERQHDEVAQIGKLKERLEWNELQRQNQSSKIYDLSDAIDRHALERDAIERDYRAQMIDYKQKQSMTQRRLEGKLEKETVDNKRLKAEVGEMQALLTEHQAALAHAHEEGEVMRAEIEMLRQQVAEGEKAKSDLSLMHSTVENMRKRHAEDTKRLNQKHEMALTDASRKIAIHQGENEDLQSTLRTADLTLKTVRNEAHKRYDELHTARREEVAELTSRTHQLESELKELRTTNRGIQLQLKRANEDSDAAQAASQATEFKQSLMDRWKSIKGGQDDEQEHEEPEEAPNVPPMIGPMSSENPGRAMARMQAYMADMRRDFEARMLKRQEEIEQRIKEKEEKGKEDLRLKLERERAQFIDSLEKEARHRRESERIRQTREKRMRRSASLRHIVDERKKFETMFEQFEKEVMKHHDPLLSDMSFSSTPQVSPVPEKGVSDNRAVETCTSLIERVKRISLMRQSIGRKPVRLGGHIASTLQYRLQILRLRLELWLEQDRVYWLDRHSDFDPAANEQRVKGVTDMVSDVEALEKSVNDAFIAAETETEEVIVPKIRKQRAESIESEESPKPRRRTSSVVSDKRHRRASSTLGSATFKKILAEASDDESDRKRGRRARSGSLLHLPSAPLTADCGVQCDDVTESSLQQQLRDKGREVNKHKADLEMIREEVDFLTQQRRDIVARVDDLEAESSEKDGVNKRLKQELAVANSRVRLLEIKLASKTSPIPEVPPVSSPRTKGVSSPRPKGGFSLTRSQTVDQMSTTRKTRKGRVRRESLSLESSPQPPHLKPLVPSESSPQPPHLKILAPSKSYQTQGDTTAVRSVAVRTHSPATLSPLSPIASQSVEIQDMPVSISFDSSIAPVEDSEDDVVILQFGEKSVVVESENEVEPIRSAAGTLGAAFASKTATMTVSLDEAIKNHREKVELETRRKAEAENEHDRLAEMKKKERDDKERELLDAQRLGEEATVAAQLQVHLSACLVIQKWWRRWIHALPPLYSCSGAIPIAVTDDRLLLSYGRRGITVTRGTLQPSSAMSSKSIRNLSAVLTEEPATISERAKRKANADFFATHFFAAKMVADMDADEALQPRMTVPMFFASWASTNRSADAPRSSIREAVAELWNHIKSGVGTGLARGMSADGGRTPVGMTLGSGESLLCRVLWCLLMAPSSDERPVLDMRQSLSIDVLSLLLFGFKQVWGVHGSIDDQKAVVARHIDTLATAGLFLTYEEAVEVMQTMFPMDTDEVNRNRIHQTTITQTAHVPLDALYAFIIEDYHRYRHRIDEWLRYVYECGCVFSHDEGMVREEFNLAVSAICPQIRRRRGLGLFAGWARLCDDPVVSYDAFVRVCWTMGLFTWEKVKDVVHNDDDTVVLSTAFRRDLPLKLEQAFLKVQKMHMSGTGHQITCRGRGDDCPACLGARLAYSVSLLEKNPSMAWLSHRMMLHGLSSLQKRIRGPRHSTAAPVIVAKPVAKTPTRKPSKKKIKQSKSVSNDDEGLNDPPPPLSDDRRRRVRDKARTLVTGRYVGGVGDGAVPESSSERKGLKRTAIPVERSHHFLPGASPSQTSTPPTTRIIRARKDIKGYINL